MRSSAIDVVPWIAAVAVALSAPSIAFAASPVCRAFGGPASRQATAAEFARETAPFLADFEGTEGPRASFFGRIARDQASDEEIIATPALQMVEAGKMSIRGYIEPNDSSMRTFVQNGSSHFLGSFALPPVVGEPVRTELGAHGSFMAGFGIVHMGLELTRRYGPGSRVQSINHLLTVEVIGDEALVVTLAHHVLTGGLQSIAQIALSPHGWPTRTAFAFRNPAKGDRGVATIDLPQSEPGGIIAVDLTSADGRALTLITSRRRALSYVLMDDFESRPLQGGARPMRVLPDGTPRDLGADEFQRYLASGLFQLVDRGRP